jgi:hypothetical protein
MMRMMMRMMMIIIITMIIIIMMMRMFTQIKVQHMGYKNHSPLELAKKA